MWVEEVYQKDPTPPPKKKKKKKKKKELKVPYEMLNGAKPLRNNKSWAEEGQRKSLKMKHSDQKGALQKPL